MNSTVKAELKKRGASLKGKKADLVERLELYDQNFNFGNTAIPENDDPSMQVPDANTYWDINSNTMLPPLNELHIRQYFCFTNKKLDEAKTLYESRYLILARASNVGDTTFIKGVCKKTMKALQYEVHVKLHQNGTPQESHCECPAGSGVEAKCKHVGVLLHGIAHMVRDKVILLHQVCTQQLQTFHVPKGPFTASPLVAHKLPKKKPAKKFTPYPIQNICKENYNTKFRSLILNFPNSTMPFKQLFEPANPYAIVWDHAYTSKNPEDELLEKLNLLHVTNFTINNIEKNTRRQKESSLWHEERKYRITASKFYTVCHLRDSSKPGFSKIILNERNFKSRATTHGILNESVALKEYVKKYDVNIEPCGLFINKERPYLGATPDGLLGNETIIEIKCPYTSRNKMISPVTVPYLVYDNINKTLVIKKSSPYYYQIQGQLYCTEKLYCNLIVYTYKEMVVIFVSRDNEFFNNMLNKLDNFYYNYFKAEILKQLLYNEYDLIKKRSQ
ncbi:uncharacterized protein LOC112057632 isoform X1 [Bicyclus anynana]|uniref:Uncharacterized protein LOC112057632 isoform X1 n=1 Tax=Bicyclus anynana TaxID=110368 RepID=A0ABM3M7G3_BICAN|nr:uncharacterized protein LOC112057632 isoform X1 [Bicyclus anynana]